MSSLDFSIRSERSADVAAIDALVQQVFGPGITTKVSHALREDVPHEPGLAFVAECEGKLIGSVRQTKILWGNKAALMLGPLAVLKSHSGQGVGRALMVASVEAARNGDHGCDIIMLVGDLPYYKPFGFKSINSEKIRLPRPVDPNRVLGCELVEGALKTFDGVAEKWGG